jgi:hypothetical protein
VREIRTLRAMWRALETGLRQFLNGHEEGNLGYKPRKSLRAAAPVLDPTSTAHHAARRNDKEQGGPHAADLWRNVRMAAYGTGGPGRSSPQL